MPTALEAAETKAALVTLGAASAASNSITWLPATANQVSGGGGWNVKREGGGSKGKIAFGSSPGQQAANAGWATGYGNLSQIGAAANAMWGPGQARLYVEGWKFPFFAAKSYEAALSHALIMQKAAAFPVEANFWGEVWSLTKGAQSKAQTGIGFD